MTEGEKRSGDEIPFVFKFKEGGTFHTTSVYTASTDSGNGLWMTKRLVS